MKLILKNESENSKVFLKIIERFERFECKSTRYQIASEEFIASLKQIESEESLDSLKEEESRVVTWRLLLTLAGSKGNLTDEYNNNGRDIKCLRNDSKFMCLEILRNEWVEH